MGSEKPPSAGNYPLRQRFLLLLWDTLDAIHTDWSFNIFYSSYSSILKQKAGLSLQLLADTAGDIYFTRLGEPF